MILEIKKSLRDLFSQGLFLNVPEMKLLNFFMNGVTAQGRIVLLLLHTFGMCLKILFSGVAGRRLAFLTSFSALQSDNTNFAFFLSHKLPPEPICIANNPVEANRNG